MRQSQFLEVIDRDEAARRFQSVLRLEPVGVETVPLAAALGRVLAADVTADIDVPGFTRSNVDGFAVHSADTFGCSEEAPLVLRLNDEHLATGVIPTVTVEAGTATVIATGGILPRGADAVIMVEHTSPADSGAVAFRRPVAPGAHLTHAGSDIARGETVLRRGTVLTGRETGVLAAVGRAQVEVYRRPRVAIFSTGDEVVAPGAPLADGQVHDANATILADTVREIGGDPLLLDIVADDIDAVHTRLQEALAAADMVLLSGGTSKGAGDVNVQAVERLPAPGVLAHGVALKPGKPVCLAAAGVTPVVILPGFPTSALFTFHEFVAPVLRAFAGRSPEVRGRRRATLPSRLNSEIGRTEYVLVGLVRGDDGGAVAVPLGKGSGSVTAFGAADGFITVPRQTEYVEAGADVEVTLISADLQTADLVIQGSHCLGLDVLVGALRQRRVRARLFHVGSSSGLAAVAAGHADLAGIHLLEPATGAYNTPFLTDGIDLIAGYGRIQGVVFRRDDPRFAGADLDAVRATIQTATDCMMINRNRGAGTRALIDELLDGARPPGHAVEARSHHAVAGAVSRGRADWGVAIEGVARLNGLGFLPLREERYDFAVRADRRRRPAVEAFATVLEDAAVQQALRDLGFRPRDRPRPGHPRTQSG